MTAFTSDRERGLHLARVYLAQTRSFGARRSPFAFTLLEWAANARRLAQGVRVPSDVDRTQFGPWWRTPKGIVIEYNQCGYNGFQCFSTPIGTAKHGQHLWHTFVIRWQRVPAFLGRCEYLGKEFPRQEVADQVARLAAVQVRSDARDDVDDEADTIEPAEQMELFA